MWFVYVVLRSKQLGPNDYYSLLLATGSSRRERVDPKRRGNPREESGKKIEIVALFRRGSGTESETILLGKFHSGTKSYPRKPSGVDLLTSNIGTKSHCTVPAIVVYQSSSINMKSHAKTNSTSQSAKVTA